MNIEEPKPESSHVPQTIFHLFIEELRKTETPSAIVDELQKLIVSGNPISDSNLKLAITKAIEI